MDAHELPLEELISPARYQRYRAAARGDTARAARLYMWNCDLSAAYWPSIALVEVAIRNAMDSQLCSHLGVTREHGWHPEVLADRPRIHLTDKELDKVKKSIDAFDRKNNTAGQPRVEPTGGDIVAELFKPLPSMVVAHYLGVPDADRDRFDGWTDAIVAANTGSVASRPAPIRGHCEPWPENTHTGPRSAWPTTGS